MTVDQISRVHAVVARRIASLSESYRSTLEALRRAELAYRWSATSARLARAVRS